MNHQVQRSKDALTALEEFLASLRTAELSFEPVTDTQVVRENMVRAENKEKEISLMKDQARHLDKRLKTLGISFKDAERGDDTCDKLLVALSRKLSETCDDGVHGELTEENKLLETCIFKNNELLKNIQDVYNQIGKISLKDPSVPAVKQR